MSSSICRFAWSAVVWTELAVPKGIRSSFSAAPLAFAERGQVAKQFRLPGKPEDDGRGRLGVPTVHEAPVPRVRSVERLKLRCW